jgi:hypothetical protein
MTRADRDPAQAEASMQLLHDEASRADDAKDDAQALVDDIEAEMDAAFAAGNEPALTDLQNRHQEAERDLEIAEQEFQSVMTQIGQNTQFWYEDEDED